MTNRDRSGANAVIGLALVALGIFFLVVQFLGVNLWRFSWPFFIIVPGLFFFVAMVLGGRSAGGLAIPGSIITMTGLILLYQTLFNHFQSWAYAWALIFPTAVGIGLFIHGLWSGNERLVRTGRGMVGWGLVIFAVGATFFELVVNISGYGRGAIGGIVWPLLLILLGLFLLLRRTVAAPASPAPTRWSDRPSSPPEPPARPASPPAEAEPIPPAAETPTPPEDPREGEQGGR